MARRLLSSWWASALRGVAALGLALLCLAHAPAPPSFGAEVFGAYAMLDGLLCGLIATARTGRGGRAALLFSAAVGAGVGAVLLAAPQVSPRALALAVAAWGLATGGAALLGGGALYRELVVPQGVVAYAADTRRQLRATPEFAMGLAGAVALTFAIGDLALSATGRAVPLGLVGAFAAPLGYLYLRAGLGLGVLALTVADAGGRRLGYGDTPELAEGTA